MKNLKSVTAASVFTSLLAAPLRETSADMAVTTLPRRRPSNKDVARRERPIGELPDDPTLPALIEIRAASQAGMLPVVDGRPVELLVHSYKPGKRIAIEARAGHRRFAIKAYSSDPALEAELYQALAAAGLGGDSAVRVPPLLAYERELRMVVIGWLDGPTAQELIGAGQGARAGELGALWLQHSASMSVKLGPRLGAAHIQQEARNWIAKLGAADPALGTAATALVEMLARTQPKEGAPRLVHGSLYVRHVLDLGDSAGLIDWDCFGQGPLEIDAGMFLATVSRIGLLSEGRAGEVARAEQAFLSGTADLLDARALAWHRAAALLHLAERGGKPTTRRQSDWSVRASVLLREAARLAEAAG
jgi:hypothetical protein